MSGCGCSQTSGCGSGNSRSLHVAIETAAAFIRTGRILHVTSKRGALNTCFKPTMDQKICVYLTAGCVPTTCASLMSFSSVVLTFCMQQEWWLATHPVHGYSAVALVYWVPSFTSAPTVRKAECRPAVHIYGITRIRVRIRSYRYRMTQPYKWNPSFSEWQPLFKRKCISSNLCFWKYSKTRLSRHFSDQHFYVDSEIWRPTHKSLFQCLMCMSPFRRLVCIYP